MSFFSRLFQSSKFENSGNCPWDNIPLRNEREAPITSTYVCPKCSYFTIKFKAIPEVKLFKEIKVKEEKKLEVKEKPKEKLKKLFKKKIEKPVETKAGEFPSLEFIKEKPLKPFPRPPKLKLKEKTLPREPVEIPEIVEEKIESKPQALAIEEKEIELPAVEEKVETRPEEIKAVEKVEIKPKKIKETAKTYKIPESSLKKALTKIIEIERRIPERVSDVSQVEELRQMIGQIERNVRQEKINIVPEIIEKLLETKERIERLKLPEKLDPITEVKNKIKELEMKREQINQAKEVVKERYYKGELDENSLKSIMENYEQELIRTEVEIKQYKKLLKDLEKKKPETKVPAQSVTGSPPSQIAVSPADTIEQPSIQQPVISRTIEVKQPIVRPPAGTMMVRPIKPPYLEEDNRPPRKKLSLIPRFPEINLKDGREVTVETSLDKILHMVEEKGSVNIGEIAKILKVKEEQIEEWGKILEEHNLVKLSYPPLGKPVLRKIK